MLQASTSYVNAGVEYDGTSTFQYYSTPPALYSNPVQGWYWDLFHLRAVHCSLYQSNSKKTVMLYTQSLINKQQVKSLKL